MDIGAYSLRPRVADDRTGGFLTPLPMSTPRLTDRRAVVVALALISFGLIACWICSRQIQSTRHALVERRLTTAVDILRESATHAVTDPDTRPDFVADMREWGRVTGLRLTLILDNGSVLADSE